MNSNDSHEVSQLNELKIDLDAIAVIAHYKGNSDIIMDEQMPIFGGYAGGVEETAIVDVATHLNSMVMSSASWHLDGPVHIRWGSTNTRETLMIAGWTCATISEFTDLLSGNQYYPCAGPCTEMCLLEAAAQSMTDTASGREILSGVASAKGVITDKTTGMEARMMGEVARATAGMDIDTVNQILDKLVASYEGDYANAPAGKTFQECYDVATVTPTEEYVKVYDGAKKKLEDLGLVF
ncbi:monomethylamine:corrinoid methyltransferase [Methanohalophilus euhalobius]|uniref:[methylamine--corrinoid protein] Co-methyltransferase n=2 Tax=Methanohalophilus TaxID=2175 RepID=A0A285EN90_9EURY|nr:MAG: methyltransferase [Methanohalophilus sp. DAL1]TCL10964.1 monomethylamine:corrinoid methyltransferase [Methanohalophilus euhalobius]SNX99461.1 monomethylamine:corrinoid methyltransferase [Methanohalophilus euhalobius]